MIGFEESNGGIFMWKRFFLVSLFIAFSGAQAAPLEVQSLIKDIKKSGAKWTPKTSWMSELSKEQLVKMMGVKGHVEPSLEDVSFAPKFGPVPGTPAALDWRNKDGQNWVSPVLNQGNCGSCVAFAAVATMETQMNIQRRLPWLTNNFLRKRFSPAEAGSVILVGIQAAPWISCAETALRMRLARLTLWELLARMWLASKCFVLVPVAAWIKLLPAARRARPKK